MLMIACFMPTMAFAASTPTCSTENCGHVAAIGTTHYDTLQEAVNAVANESTAEIMLLKSCEGPGVFLGAGSKTITINFNNNTYTVNALVGSSDTENQAFHLEKGTDEEDMPIQNTVVLKNGGIAVADSQKSAAKILIQNYCNLTIDNMKLYGTNLQMQGKDRYVISNNDGIVNVIDSEVTASKYTDDKKANVAIDAAIWGSYKGADVRIENSKVDGKLEVAKYESIDGVWTKTENLAQNEGKPCITVKSGSFTDIESAIIAAADNATIKLLSNVQLSAPIDIEKHITVDLDGKTISAADNFAGGDYILGVKRGGELTINDSGENGKIDSNSKDVCGIKLTLKGEADTGTNACLNVNGGTIIGKEYGISGNGLRQDTVINFNGGTVKASDPVKGIAIYQPQRGTLTITDGNIEANTALVVKSGTLTISGGTIKATGEKKAFSHNGNGFYNTGDALVVEACDYPGGLPVVVSISGGTFTSAKADAVAYYKQNDEYDIVNKKFITGGTFSSDPSAYVADNYVATKSGETWTVKAKSTSGGGFVVIPTETPLDKAKTEANTAVSAAASANKYDDAEQAEVKKILDKAAADIKNAKTEEEVKAIQEAAQAEIDKVLTTEEKAQIKAVNGVDKEIFKAKSKYSKLRGKRAIKVTWNVPNGMKFDGFEIYRSTKKFSGYGKTPYFTTTKTSYINNKGLVKGKTYYYKVRAFVIINGEKVYTDYSTKAFRIIK